MLIKIHKKKTLIKLYWVGQVYVVLGCLAVISALFLPKGFDLVQGILGGVVFGIGFSVSGYSRIVLELRRLLD